MYMLSTEELLERGYTQFIPNYQFKSKDIELCYQKRFNDKNGKKYFITINKWRAFTMVNGTTIPSNFEYEVQLYSKNEHEPLDLLFHSDWTLDRVEKYMEQLWNTGLFDYYEMFE